MYRLMIEKKRKLWIKCKNHSLVANYCITCLDNKACFAMMFSTKLDLEGSSFLFESNLER